MQASDFRTLQCPLWSSYDTEYIKDTEALGEHSWWDGDSNYSYLTVGSMKGLSHRRTDVVDGQSQTFPELSPHAAPGKLHGKLSWP